MRPWSRAGIELLHEVVAAGECLVTTTAFDCKRGVVRTDPVWELLRAIERSSYCCSIADAARLLRISRQAAHKTASKAASAGAIELVPNRDDRRIVQIVLTRSGRSELAAAWSAQAGVVTVLLNGLDLREIDETAHIVRVIRQRLVADERDRRRARR
jgi:DNA-binding MarR family transcriptional regulator